MRGIFKGVRGSSKIVHFRALFFVSDHLIPTPESKTFFESTIELRTSRRFETILGVSVGPTGKKLDRKNVFFSVDTLVIAF